MQIYCLVYAFESYTDEACMDMAYVENVDIENTLLGTYASLEGALAALRYYQPLFFASNFSKETTDQELNELNPSIIKSITGKVSDLTSGCLMVIESTLK